MVTEKSWYACPHCIQPLGMNINYCHYCENDIIPVLMTADLLTQEEGKWREINRLREEDLIKAETEFDDNFKGSSHFVSSKVCRRN